MELVEILENWVS